MFPPIPEARHCVTAARCCLLLCVPLLLASRLCARQRIQSRSKPWHPQSGRRLARLPRPGRHEHCRPERGVAAGRKPDLAPFWQLELGTGYGSPTISRGRLFVFDRVEKQARLRCLNAETGDALWKFEYPTEYVDSYGYANGPVAAPSWTTTASTCTASRACSLPPVVDGRNSGRSIRRRIPLPAKFFGVGSTPVIEGDLLIAMVGGSTAGGSDDNAIRKAETRRQRRGRLRQANREGQVPHRRRTGELFQPDPGDVAGKRLLLRFARGGLLAFDPANGKVDFHFPWRAKVLESVNAANPVVVDGQILLTECYGPGPCC